VEVRAIELVSKLLSPRMIRCGDAATGTVCSYQSMRGLPLRLTTPGAPIIRALLAGADVLL
jgi:hypothetical protein